jgi:peptidoglycan/LPS O-acetylase OafA/YrhL
MVATVHAVSQQLLSVAPLRGSRTRTDGLNLVRLVLALAVLVSHGVVTAGLAEPRIAGETLGGWAVAAFFAISGYLVAGSRLTHTMPVYLAHRLGRIMPAYWVSLVVTAVLALGVLVGTTGLTTTALRSAVTFVTSNIGLVQVQPDVAGTPVGVPYPGVWNASLWTLAYEFACYLVIGVLVWLLPAARARRRVVLAVIWIGVLAVHAGAPHLLTDVPEVLQQAARLGTFFLGGALLQSVCRPRDLRPGVAFLLLAAALGLVVANNRVGAEVGAPLWAYVLLSAGCFLPSPRAIRDHDISYGTYIYAFPVSQLLVIVGLREAGLGLFLAGTVALTVTLGALSWVLVERPALRAVKGRTTVRHG